MNPVNDMLAKENEKLRQENATKSDLISISAHQLRTSLSAMKWILKMFIDGDFGELTAEQMNFMKKAFESDDRMIRLVNEMLSINHAEDSLETMHLEETDIVKLLDEVVFDFTGESYKKGIQLIFLKPDHPLKTIVVDPEKIRVVIQNLVENAVKYTEKDGRVFIHVVEKENGVEISVRDTGIGIDVADQPSIFGKFFRAPNAKKLDVVGSGLGLYTTQRIVENHKGKIWFESVIGQGTTFFVTLPNTLSALKK
ncbi:MAG: HAMP domain-containing histidine kinase [Candidatus Pacebacteria bacterium]|nr:HAMP domain-containing histidine kinase [Candidatus Paceibacterota bacterium]